MRIPFKYLLVFALISLPSCRAHRDVYCYDPILEIFGIGYTANDLAKVNVYAYKKNNLFDSLIDSVFTDSVRPQSFDTSLFTALSVDRDYVISLPAINKTYYIAGITQKGLLQKTFSFTVVPLGYPGHFECYNSALQCVVNGITYPVYNNDGSRADTLYIRK